jgi:hypothetical protein
LTGRFGCQQAADPDHRAADGAADAPLGLAGCDESPPPGRRALFAPTLPFDLNVVGMDQHLESPPFWLVSVAVVALLDVVVE